VVRARRQRSITFAVFAAILCSYTFRPALAGERTTANSDLDRVTYAVDGAESSHGKDLSMWRPDPAGPQGPMQVSEKAARDVGNGDRFEAEQNRALGRAYLALLYRRYGNWADAISAYNWGIGKVDSWIRAGRPREKVVPGVVVYVRRVLHDSGVCRVAPGQLISSGSTSARFADSSSSWKLTKAADERGLDCLLADSLFNNKITSVATTRSDTFLLLGMEQSGRPLPRLANSGRILPGMEQSGRLLPGLEQSGLLLRRASRQK
jgi:Transglycosylase SLT domain